MDNMNTAPKDGSKILVWADGNEVEKGWYIVAWINNYINYPNGDLHVVYSRKFSR
jgi:hypothetical protein